MDFKDKQNLPAIFSSDPSAIAAAAAVKARIESAYMMALHKPRNFDQSRMKILEACKRPEFAEEVEFDRIQGKKKNPKTGKWEDNHILGLTIRFTEVALTSWTNVLTESQMIYEDENIRRVRIAVLDLEENVCFSHDIQFSKTVERKNKRGRIVVGERKNIDDKTVYIVKATDEELQNKENALVSKTLRNEGLRVIPEDIKKEAIKLARETVLNEDAKDPGAAKKTILDGFAGLGVWPKDIEKYLKHSLDVVTPKELQQLRAIYKAVKDGEATWHSYIEEEDPEEKPPSTGPGQEGAAQKLYAVKQPTTDNQKPPGPPEGENKGDDTPEGEKGAGSEEPGDLVERIAGFRKPGFATFLQNEWRPDMPQSAQVAVMQKHMNLFKKAFDPENPLACVEGKESEAKEPIIVEKQDDTDDWNGLWWKCPDMEGNPIPKTKCKPENCPQYEGCPSPYKPKAEASQGELLE